MASRRLVPPSVREALLGIPSAIASLERNYLLADDDLDWIGTRRRPENRLGLALHIALLRHPGQGWHDDTEPPAPLVAWLVEQIEGPFPALARYGSRGGQRAPTTGGWPSGISACVRSCLRTTCEQRWTWLPGRRSTPRTVIANQRCSCSMRRFDINSGAFLVHRHQPLASTTRAGSSKPLPLLLSSVHFRYWLLNSTSPRHRASCQTRRRSGTATQ